MEQPRPGIQTAIEKQQIGMVIRILHQQFRRLFEENARSAQLEDITSVHGRILSFLIHNAERDVYQKDIEQAFHINRSTVTSILQVMEKKGLITRSTATDDNRLKKVSVTAHGIAMHQRVIAVIEQTEEQMRSGLTADELQTFLALAEKIENHVGRYYLAENIKRTDKNI